MKTIKGIIAFLAMAFLAMALGSCSKDSNGSEANDSFNWIWDANEFARNASKGIVIDYRTESDYANGHIEGAYNIPALDNSGMLRKDWKWTDGNGEFCSKVKEIAGGTDKKIFLYGNKDQTRGEAIAGQVSKSGFGKKNTYICLKGYEAIKAAFDKLGK